jgi:hypothetical protein
MAFWSAPAGGEARKGKGQCLRKETLRTRSEYVSRTSRDPERPKRDIAGDVGGEKQRGGGGEGLCVYLWVGFKGDRDGEVFAQNRFCQADIFFRFDFRVFTFESLEKI